MKKTMIYQIKKSGAVLLGWALSLVLLTMIPLAASAQSSCTLSDTPTDVSRWIESRFAKGKVPPFSFVYDGKPSAGLLRKWKYTAQRVESSEPGVREYLYSYQDRRSGLKVECRVKGFADFGAVEWVLNFKNLSRCQFGDDRAGQGRRSELDVSRRGRFHRTLCRWQPCVESRFPSADESAGSR